MTPSISQIFFGKTPQGEEVSLFTLVNAAGMAVKISNFGGVITSICVPDRDGVVADVVLGFDELEPYISDSPYFGALIGRVGNRIAKGHFELQGQSYRLAINNGENHLHGGLQGFDKVVWSPTTFVGERHVGLKLFYFSPNGDQGYPGNLQVMVTYTLMENNSLMVDYHATTDQPTPINMTQHSYFNLAGGGDVLAHQLMINASHFTPVDGGLIPTGKLQAVGGSAFDFRTAKTIGEHINNDEPQLLLGGGYDHNFVLDKSQPKELSLAARALEPICGRVLEVYTQEPAVQFYSGNFLDGSLSGKGHVYAHRSGFCIEPQHYPDSLNQPSFPSIILHPGEEYASRTAFRFSTN